MKKIFSTIAVILLISSCRKESVCDNCQPSQPIPNQPPVAFAGLDQVVYLPQDSAYLYGTASSDPENKIASYKWRQLSGPSSSTISNAETSMAHAKGLVLGTYQFELTITDAGGLIDKDTTLVNVLNLVQNEVIFTDRQWDCSWDCWVSIPDVYSHIPQGVDIKVYIKRDNIPTWVEVPPFPASGVYAYGIYNGELVVVASEIMSATDTPDIKIVY